MWYKFLYFTLLYWKVTAAPAYPKHISMQPCVNTDDSAEDELKNSQLCKHINISPGSIIDPMGEITFWGQFVMPFTLDEGTIAVALKVDGRKVLQDTAEYNCAIIRGIPMLLMECPFPKGGKIDFEKTFSDLINLQPFAGDYSIDISIENGNQRFCCSLNFTVLDLDENY